MLRHAMRRRAALRPCLIVTRWATLLFVSILSLANSVWGLLLRCGCATITLHFDKTFPFSATEICTENNGNLGIKKISSSLELKGSNLDKGAHYWARKQSNLLWQNCIFKGKKFRRQLLIWDINSFCIILNSEIRNNTMRTLILLLSSTTTRWSMGKRAEPLTGSK